MTRKHGYVRNPLTVISIFAAIAEISGTTVLPFISPGNQSIYVWFLIAFPTLLVVIFFITLNFNHKVLYAPSDYTDENNFVKLFGKATPTERDEKLREDVEDASAAPQSDYSPPATTDRTKGDYAESPNSQAKADTAGTHAHNRALLSKVALAEQLAVSDLSRRLGVSLNTNAKFNINGRRHYIFDGMAVQNGKIHVLEVKLIRYRHSVLGRFDKVLSEAEQLASRPVLENGLVVHMYAVIDDESLEEGRLEADSIRHEMEHAAARYAVETNVMVTTLRELEDRFAMAA